MSGAESKLLVTGGAGFIGSAMIRSVIESTGASVVNLDKLTYTGDLSTVAAVAGSDRYAFEQLDVCDGKALDAVFRRHRPTAVVHFAAETHVDRSIDGPAAFIETNVLGTYSLLEAARRYWSELPKDAAERFRLLHVSTDEVYGSLGPSGTFTETSPYQPNSPYSASKAAADHLVRAWFQTYGLPTIVTNCSNNYGPYQFPDKLIPLMIANALAGQPLPVYGTGDNVRDWLFVDDHVAALRLVLRGGRPGQTYAVGGGTEMTNLALVERLCDLLDQRLPDAAGGRRRLITFVADRPGHDRRYAIDHGKITAELGWMPRESFETGLAKTIDWYVRNQDWVTAIRERRYDGRRLGLRQPAE